jgi:VWFA-related protein
MHTLPRLLMASIALAACAYGAPDQPFVDSSRADLIKAAPELSVLEFDSDQSTLDPLLRATGQQLENMLAKFINVSIAEEVHEMRFDNAHLMWKEHRDKFRYVVGTRPFAESRRQAQSGDAAQPNAKSSFLISGRFLEMLSDLLPANQNQSRFRCLGLITEGGGRSLVMAFTARDGTRQGLVWVDEATKRIVRFRTDVLKHPEGQKFDSFTRDVRFVPVNFFALETTLWLPSSATVHVRFATGELHSVHRFSDYHAEEKDTDATQLKERYRREKDTGEATEPVGMEDDGIEVLLKGVVALEEGKPGDAVAPLREATGRLAERFEPGYYLGLALYGTHDLAGAETQFREAARRSPSLAAAHNELGAVLFERGDKPGAAAEFQEALRLEPGNAKMLANLDEATRKPGDQRVATEVPVSPATGEVTIKVNVRQVLVPVVVTDKEGHHVTSLTQTDFKVFEDGVEQKITAFDSERADVSTPVSPSAEPSQPDTVAAAGSPKLLAKRHQYVICLDMMHASFGNFVYVREALQKLFQQEQAGDSQYVIIGLGMTMEIVQNATSDPAKVLETLGGANFRKMFQQSQKSSSQFYVSRYEGELQEVRTACDAGDSICGIRKQSLPQQANGLAEHERFSTTQFLTQLRSVVEQLARGDGRRTLVLISDGFLLAPGKISFGLLEAYFPEFRSTRTVERMQDSLEPIFRLAAKGNVPIYTIDSRGLYTSPGLDVSRDGVSASVAPQVDRALNDIATDEGLTLSQIAAATGGTAFQNNNDLSAGLKRAFADGREYYMLAYVPTNETQDGKFRKIEVRVRDNRAAVSAKRGYWATLQ